MKNNVLVLKANPINERSWKPITISTQLHASIKEIANETKMPISKIACLMLDFACEHVVIEKQSKFKR
ncbi:MAG: hypothetical protein GX273_06115 [Bacteroidales bacterium]|jgi:hypothetical protein|nr:hypothetical protein [Bacteroidales bacterium]